jgi:hypothetical protein
MNKLKTWANNRGLGVGNLFVFSMFVGIGAVVSVMPFPDEDYEPINDGPEDDEPTAEEILEGLRDGTYISIRNEQGETVIYKRI